MSVITSAKEVLFSPLSVQLPVGLSAGLHKNDPMDFHETGKLDVSQLRTDNVNCEYNMILFQITGFSFINLLFCYNTTDHAQQQIEIPSASFVVLE